MKETGTAHWLSPNTGATNESGFTALPGGNRTGIGIWFGIFYNVGSSGHWWGRYNLNFSGCFSMGNNSNNVGMTSEATVFGFSVRCLQD